MKPSKEAREFAASLVRRWPMMSHKVALRIAMSCLRSNHA